MRCGWAGGRRGRRTRRRPACSGRRSPLRRLQGMQHVTMFSHSLRPPRATGHHVVEGELRRGEAVAAVLARVVVAGVDVRAGERHVGEGSFHTDVTEEAKHRGKPHPDRDAPDLPVVDGDDLDLALEEEGDRFLPRHDPQGLVSGVQDERLVHRSDQTEILPVTPEGCQGWGRPARSGRLARSLLPSAGYRWTRAEPPFMTRSTSARVAMVVSPGVVMARAPWAAPQSTAHCGSLPGQEAVDEAGGEGVAAADAVPDLEAVVGARLVEPPAGVEHGRPVVDRGGARRRAASWPPPGSSGRRRSPSRSSSGSSRGRGRRGSRRAPRPRSRARP